MAAIEASPHEAEPPLPHGIDEPGESIDEVAQLIEHRRAGNHEALGELLVRKRSALVGYLRNHVDSDEVAEDLAHDVLVRALSHLDEVDAGRPLWPWLMIIARNRLIDHYRRVSTAQDAAEDPRVTEVLGAPGCPSDLSEFADPASRYEERELLQHALRPLGRRQRSALILHDAQDWTSDQIAELFDRDRNAVHQILYRARATARKEYLRLSGERSVRAVVLAPLGIVWQLARRGWGRVREVASHLSPAALPAGSESLGGLMAATVGLGVGLLLATGAPPTPPATGDPGHPTAGSAAVPVDAVPASLGGPEASTAPEVTIAAVSPTVVADGGEGPPSVAGATERLRDVSADTSHLDAAGPLAEHCPLLVADASCRPPGISTLEDPVTTRVDVPGLAPDDVEDVAPDLETADADIDETTTASEDETSSTMEETSPTADGTSPTEEEASSLAEETPSLEESAPNDTTPEADGTQPVDGDQPADGDDTVSTVTDGGLTGETTSGADSDPSPTGSGCGLDGTVTTTCGGGLH